MTSSPAATASAGTACLVLMLKAPQRAKRRLAAEIGGHAATAAAEHLAACALEDAAAWPGPVCYAPAGEDDGAWLVARVPPRSRLLVQRGRNLGERIQHVDRALRAAGRERRVFIGMDCPQLDLGYLLRAARALERHDVVLGPAEDGGAVVMGTRRAWPDLSALPWSQPSFLDALHALCADSALTTKILAPLPDVDTRADLLAARSRLGGDDRPARVRFRRWLDQQAEEIERCV